MKQKSKIKVIDSLNNEILKEFPLDEAHFAYEYAAQMESYGVDIKVIEPTITETLVDSLGMTLDMKEEYAQSVVAELADHDGCCNEIHDSSNDSNDVKTLN